MTLNFHNRKIIKLNKPYGSTQYFLTLPKDFAESLISKGITELLLVSNYTLVVFPKEVDIEQRIMEFLTKHQRFTEQIFTGGKKVE